MKRVDNRVLIYNENRKCWNRANNYIEKIKAEQDKMLEEVGVNDNSKSN